jgi:hypothetical protein
MTDDTSKYAVYGSLFNLFEKMKQGHLSSDDVRMLKILSAKIAEDKIVLEQSLRHIEQVQNIIKTFIPVCENLSRTQNSTEIAMQARNFQTGTTLFSSLEEIDKITLHIAKGTYSMFPAPGVTAIIRRDR